MVQRSIFTMVDGNHGELLVTDNEGLSNCLRCPAMPQEAINYNSPILGSPEAEGFEELKGSWNSFFQHF